jgi:hypothetical protein
MSIFIERFLLAILATLAVLLAVTNPMGYSGTARVIGVIVIFVLAGIAAYFADGFNENSYSTTNGFQKPPRPQLYQRPVAVWRRAGTSVTVRSTPEMDRSARSLCQ